MKRVHLNRALSKLGLLTRSQATAAILAGRVSVNGNIVRDPGAAIDIERARMEVAQDPQDVTRWRTVLLNKPRGVVTTTSDPQGRPTVYSLLGEDAEGLVPVGRLDLASTGLLLLTSDTELAGWLTSAASAVPRVYVATVRGRVTPDETAQMEQGMMIGGEVLAAASVSARKVSDRESHLTIELREGKNRDVRRLCEAIGHEVTRLKRVAFGGLQLGQHLAPGQWRDLTHEEVAAAFPGAPLRPA